MKRILYISILALVIVACDEPAQYEFPCERSAGSSYFPLEYGSWREFMVTEITIDEPIALYDTQHYFIREQIGDIFIDNIGDTMRQIERFSRKSQGSEWSRQNSWMAYVKDDEVIQVEENTRYLKMLLPLSDGKKWNGNIYNRTDTLQEYEYCVENIDAGMQLGEFYFDSVLTISQKDELTAITKVSFIERYAKNVGLVYKHQIDIYSDNYEPDVDIADRITQGTLIYYDLIGYGK